MKNRLYEVDWSFPDGTSTTEPIKKYCIGSILNVCCGKSKLGDVRIDLDPSINCDLRADCKNLPIKKNSFDTVIIDPPYQYFCTGSDRFRWFYKMADIADKRLILSLGQTFIALNKFNLVKIVASIAPNLFFVRLWYIYDRIQTDLLIE